MNICWWEYDDLVDHFSSRNDLWTRSEDNPGLWLRSVEGESQCAVMVGRTAKTGPFRQHSIRIVPSAWSQEECDTYLDGLLRHWTSYGKRQQVRGFMIDSLNTAPETADLAAVALLAGIYSDDVFPDPEKEARQMDLFGTPNQPDPAELPEELKYDVFPRGYISLRKHQNAFFARLSVPSHKDYGGGFGPALVGFVRPVCGQIDQTMAFLAGTPLEPSEKISPEEQLSLLEEE